MGNDQSGTHQGTSPGQQDADNAKDSLRRGQKGGSEVREDRGIVDETDETDETDQTHVYDEALSRTRKS
jgi:hypothetical protein